MRLYKKYFLIHVQSQMQHKLSFVLTMLGQFFVSFTALVGIFFMFGTVHEVQGFTLNQVMICFAVVLAAFSIAECFARGFDMFPSMISNGEFDRVLVRPRGEIFQVLASKVELTRVARLMQSIVMLVYAIPRAGIVWTLPRVSVLALMIAGGSVIFSALFLIYAGFTFFTIEGLEFMNVLTDGGREFGRYPFGIYGKQVLTFLTCVVPLALFQYYPLLFLLGRSTSALYALAPLLGTLFALPAYAFWRFGVGRYKSTGS